MSWSRADTTHPRQWLTPRDQLHCEATAAAVQCVHLRALMKSHVLADVGNNRVAGKSLVRGLPQLQSTDTAPAWHFKDNSPVKPAQPTGAEALPAAPLSTYQSTTGE